MPREVRRPTRRGRERAAIGNPPKRRSPPSGARCVRSRGGGDCRSVLASSARTSRRGVDASSRRRPRRSVGAVSRAPEKAVRILRAPARRRDDAGSRRPRKLRREGGRETASAAKIAAPERGKGSRERWSFPRRAAACVTRRAAKPMMPAKATAAPVKRCARKTIRLSLRDAGAAFSSPTANRFRRAATRGGPRARGPVGREASTFSGVASERRPYPEDMCGVLSRRDREDAEENRRKRRWREPARRSRWRSTGARRAREATVARRAARERSRRETGARIPRAAEPRGCGAPRRAQHNGSPLGLEHGGARRRRARQPPTSAASRTRGARSEATSRAVSPASPAPETRSGSESRTPPTESPTRTLTPSRMAAPARPAARLRRLTGKPAPRSGAAPPRDPRARRKPAAPAARARLRPSRRRAPGAPCRATVSRPRATARRPVGFRARPEARGPRSARSSGTPPTRPASRVARGEFRSPARWPSSRRSPRPRPAGDPPDD